MKNIFYDNVYLIIIMSAHKMGRFYRLPNGLLTFHDYYYCHKNLKKNQTTKRMMNYNAILLRARMTSVIGINGAITLSPAW